MNDFSRRDSLKALSAGVASLSLAALSSTDVQAQDAAPPAFRGQHKPRPLSFDPAKLTGLSEKLVRSHWENNYIGSVRALNMISERLVAAMREPEFPAVVYGGLKREELHRVGSVVLHEHYFGNLGGDGKAAGNVLGAIKSAYGTYDAWEAEFRRTAMSLAGGSGWCVLTYNLYTHELRNQWAWDHMHGAIAGVPLLVL